MGLLSVKSLKPSVPLWFHRFPKTLVQILICCLVKPSNYLPQCWGVNVGLISHEMFKISAIKMCLEIAIIYQRPKCWSLFIGFSLLCFPKALHNLMWANKSTKIYWNVITLLQNHRWGPVATVTTSSSWQPGLTWSLRLIWGVDLSDMMTSSNGYIFYVTGLMFQLYQILMNWSLSAMRKHFKCLWMSQWWKMQLYIYVYQNRFNMKWLISFTTVCFDNVLCAYHMMFEQQSIDLLYAHYTNPAL